MNIILNAIFIPKYQASGAALASSISTLLLFVVGFYSVVKYANIKTKDIATATIKLLLSTSLMGIVMWLLSIYIQLYWIVVILVGLVVYVVFLFITKTITPAEIRNLFKS